MEYIAVSTKCTAAAEETVYIMERTVAVVKGVIPLS